MFLVGGGRMKLVLHSITHHKCPIEQREKVSLDEIQRRALLKKLRSADCISEAVILQTCNRTEIYLYAGKNCDTSALLAALIREAGPDAFEPWRKYARLLVGVGVVRHLFEVAGGLDSQMLGESQVLAQVKAAYTESLEAGMSRYLFHRLFHTAFRAGKAVRSQTSINCGAVSISLAAVELAAHKIDLTNATAMVIGAGENAALAARYLHKSNVSDLIIANRNKNKAEALCCRLKAGRSIGLADIPEELGDVDLVVASTGSQQPVLTYRSVRAAIARRKRPLLMIDIAVPRDIEAKVADFKCVTLVNIDDLNKQIEANRAKRSRQIPKARRIVGKFVAQFGRWQQSLDVVPVIARLSQKADELAKAEARRYAKDFAKDGRQKLEIFARSLAKKLLHGPIAFLKSDEKDEPTIEQAEAADMVARMFLSQQDRRRK